MEPRSLGFPAPAGLRGNLVAFAVLVTAARTAATGTQLPKIHTAHSLDVSNRRIFRQVILPNSLPEPPGTGKIIDRDCPDRRTHSREPDPVHRE